MLRLAELLGPSCFIMPRFTSFNVLDWWYCRNKNRAWNPHRMGKVHLMWPKWILNFFIRNLYKHLMLFKKKNLHHFFFFISKVLEMRNTSVAIRRSFWALTSNWITCTSSSAGVKPLRYQLPAEEICHGATSINLCHILKGWIKLYQFHAAPLKFEQASYFRWSARAEGARQSLLLHRSKFVPHPPIFIKPCLLAFIF